MPGPTSRAPGTHGWFAPVMDVLHGRSEHPDATVRSFLDLEAPLTVARAPGRLDVMGGIADYSGSLVLELPLDRATFAVIQAQTARYCDVVSLLPSGARSFRVALDRLHDGDLATPEAVRAHAAERREDAWAAYVLGVIHFCLHRLPDAGAAWPPGLRVLLTSDVPPGKGVASSAALEVATLRALTAHLGVVLDPHALAVACQWVENHVVGAPCGVMDQMTSALGRADALLRLRCQPADVEGHVPVPPGYRFFGIDSGIRHAVAGASYGTVRTAAFMGRRLLADAAPDAVPGGYLANLSPAELDGRFARVLPRGMTGRAFLELHDDTGDPVTTVDPDREYAVWAATAHPVRENARVERFAELLGALPDRDAAVEMGEAMYASHDSYGACGLGSDGTDRLVAMVRDAGPARGLFGAKITGGGNGGTVAVFGTSEAEGMVREIATRYRHETGRPAEVFHGSSPGAAETGVLSLRRPPAGSTGPHA